MKDATPLTPSSARAKLFKPNQHAIHESYCGQVVFNYIVTLIKTLMSVFNYIVTIMWTMMSVFNYIFTIMWTMMSVFNYIVTIMWTMMSVFNYIVTMMWILLSVFNYIFTFNKHFDKENDCVHAPVITKPHHWRRLFITFIYIVNFLLQKLDLPYEVDYHMCRQVN